MGMLVRRLLPVLLLLVTACVTPEPPPGPTPTPAAPPEQGGPAVPTPTTAPPEPTPTTTPAPRPRVPLGKEIARGLPDDPRVALTFDCGAGAGPATAILDTLKRSGVKATFFVTGAFGDANPELTKRIATDGHEVANHTYSHRDLTTMGDAAIADELQRGDAALVRATGKSSKPWMRMPFGARNERVWDAVAQAGYVSVYWTLDSGDWLADATAQSVRRKVVEGSGNGAIVVQHCGSPQTAEALPDILQSLRSKGHEVATVSSLLGYGPATVTLTEPVSKSHSLPAEYVPPDLVELTGVPATRPGLLVRQAVQEPLKRMLDDAKQHDLAIAVLSTYRSYDEQAVIFAGYARRAGPEQANRFSARPGQSEHQLGTAIDFTSPSVQNALVEEFGGTAEGRWLRDNAHRYGFVLSYAEGKEAVTGYSYEPWHYRYLGEDTAAALRRSGLTLHEYLAGRPS